MELRQRPQAATQTAAKTATMQGTRAEIDAGLRDYFRFVYNQMVIGLCLTALVAWGVSKSPDMLLWINSSMLTSMLVAFGPFIFLMAGLSPRRISMMSLGKAQMMFWIFSALMGLSMSYIFAVYTGSSVARAFFITAGMFAGMSLFGYTTKKDLSGMRSFLMMGMIGIILASVVNWLFLESGMMDFVISIVSVIVFTGLTAFETQNLKSIYYSAASRDMTYKAGVLGAVNLYMSFIILFQHILHFTGQQD